MNKKSVFLFLSLIAFIFSPLTRAEKEAVDYTVATVNTELVLNSDISDFLKTMQLRQELDPLFGTLSEVNVKNPPRSKIIEFLIQEKLICQAFKTTDEEVENEIQSVQNSNSLSREDLIQFLKGKGYSFDEYKALMKVGLCKRALLDKEIRTRVNITEDDKKNYYYNNTLKNSKIPAEYSIQLISITKSNYKTARLAQETAENALKALKQGEAFTDVAKRVSDDPSKDNGGDLGGFISLTNLNEALQGQIKKLKRDNFSNVIETDSNFMIVKLVDFKIPDIKEMNDKKEAIGELLAKEEYKKQLQIWAERATNTAHIRRNE